MGKPVSFGLDISDRSIDLVSLIRKEGKIMVDRYGRAELPPGAIDRGVIGDAGAVSKAIANLLHSVYGAQKPRAYHAGIAVPETQIFSKVFRLPPNLGPDLAAQAAEQDAKDMFPIDLRHALKEAAVVHRDKDGQDVYFAAVMGTVVQGYAEVVRGAGVDPLFFDSEAVSMARALIRPEDPPTLIADIGARSTMLSVVEEGGVRMTSTIAVAGNDLTQAIETKLEVPLAEAERLKRANGFDPNAEDDRIFFLLQAPMREIVQEMRRILDYHRRKSGRAIAKVLLTGGGSLTPFLTEYLASNLAGVSIGRADPLAKVHIDDSALGDAFHKTVAVHTASIGLALRALGVMTHPQLTFLAERPTHHSFSKLFKAVGDYLTSMAPQHVKRPAPDKKPLKKTEPPSISTAPSSSAPAPSHASDDSVLAQLSPAIEAQKELAEEAAAAPTDADHLAAIAPPTNDQLYAEQMTGRSGKTQGEIDEEDLYHTKQSMGDGSMGPRRSRGGFLALVVLVLILAIAAVAGVTMFLKKNDMMSGLLAGFAGKGKPALVQDAQAPMPPESVAATFRVRVGDAVADGAVADAMPVLVGRLLETDVSVKDSFTSSGAKPSVGGKAKGTVTIINTTATPYTFVATTRVLSKDGVLFRIDKPAAIPANGSVKAAVTADKAGPEGDIAPTTFSIPGLGASFEGIITAKSDAAMTGGAGGETPAISVDDIVTVKQALHDKAILEATADLDALRRQTEHLDVALFIDKEVSFTTPEAGTSGTSFDATLSLNVKAITLPEDEAEKLLQAALVKELPEGTSAAAYTTGSVAYHVVAFDVDKLEAEVRIEASIMAAE
jgi:type IV pilus assembly protein PilM